MANSNLVNAKKAKNDEFYTQYSDIQKEIEAYLEYDPKVFRDKVVYCNCDDPYESNFFRYFVFDKWIHLRIVLGLISIFKIEINHYSHEITVTGSALNSFSQIRIFLRKYDSSGHLTLDRSYRNDIDGITYFIKETPDSGFVIAAAGRVFPARENCYLIKTDNNGEIIADIQNIYKDKISIYPNPFSNNFKIDFIENGNYEIKFYNSTGSLFLKENFQGNVLSFDLNKYSDGIYLVKIQDKKSNKIYSEKFIKISDK